MKKQTIMKSIIGIVLTILAVILISYTVNKSPDGNEISVTEPSTTNKTTIPAAPTQAEINKAHENIPVAQDGKPLINPNANFTHFRVGPRNIKDILADGDIIWVATSGGVIRYDTTADTYKLLDVRTGLLANGIFSLSKFNGRLLAGTYGGGMSLLKENGEGWDTYNIVEGLADAFVYDVLELDNGNVWIATWSGANRVRGGKLDEADKWDTFTVKNTNDGLPNDWVYGMAKGIDGSVWFATEGGLAHYKEGQWRNWQHEDGLGAAYELVRKDIEYKDDPAKISKHHARQKVEMGLQDVDVAYNPNYIVALLVDSQGLVWCGTWGGGLAMFDGTKWTNYTVRDGLPANHVFSLYEDHKGQIWIGTSKGLARKDGDTFTIYTTSDGLFANNIFSMTTVANGDFWIGSFGGVARIKSLR